MMYYRLITDIQLTKDSSKKNNPASSPLAAIKKEGRYVYCSSDSVFAAAHCLSCCLLCWMFRLLLLTETMIYGYTIDCGSELDVCLLMTVKLS